MYVRLGFQNFYSVEQFIHYCQGNFPLCNRNAIEMTVIRDLSKQIEERARIVEAFARWLLAIAITSSLIFVASSS